ncbi:integrase [Amycolatopsis sp. TNS106]|uniref:integrase n=1 Tax=Amycolatopsis sp. TNS106 TaxID=2861750 RepID=UPI001C583401|nr:integrase [Amycolatopsis sp. TNS106]QXV56937.1 integrase [Amycolatopsis sp. TNS106]
MRPAVRNLLMDLEDANGLARIKFLIRDRGAKYAALIDEVLSSAGIATVLTGVRIPRMNAITERWVKTLRAELPGRSLNWNETRLRYAFREHERHCSSHRTRRSLAAPAPLKPDQLEHLVICRQDRIGEVIHEYRLAA